MEHTHWFRDWRSGESLWESKEGYIVCLDSAMYKFMFYINDGRALLASQVISFMWVACFSFSALRAARRGVLPCSVMTEINSESMISRANCRVRHRVVPSWRIRCCKCANHHKTYAMDGECTVLYAIREFARKRSDAHANDNSDFPGVVDWYVFGTCAYCRFSENRVRFEMFLWRTVSRWVALSMLVFGCQKGLSYV